MLEKLLSIEEKHDEGDFDEQTQEKVRSVRSAAKRLHASILSAAS